MAVQRLSVPYQADSIARFERLQLHSSAGFLLDSGREFAQDTTDVMGFDPVLVERLSPDAECAQFKTFLDKLIAQLAESAEPGSDFSLPLPGWYGIWSYDLGALTEGVDLTFCVRDLPLAWMGFFPVILVTDHLRKQSWINYLKKYETQAAALEQKLLGSTVSQPTQVAAQRFQPQWSFEDYQTRFQRVKEWISEGDCYQVNLAQKYTAQFSDSTVDLYRQLRQAHSAPMGSYFKAEDWALLSISPERFITCNKGQVLTKPIKGTRARLDDPESDIKQVQNLCASQKDRAENLMIVDLLRNDLSKNCQPGSVKVTKLFDVESFANVHHLVSSVTGTLKSEVHPLQLLADAFPGGSITGAPKHRAMEIIDSLESENRQFYCGSLVYCDVSGRLDSNILIRTLVAHKGFLDCWAGGGIVADSACELEYQETLDKVEALLRSCL